MRIYIRIASRYIAKYPQRSIAMLLSIALSVFLIVVIGSLNESSRNADVMHCKNYAGAKHVIYREINLDKLEKINANKNVKRMATLLYYDGWNSSNGLTVNLLAADADILYMENTQMQAGKFPTQSYEIAIEGWVLDQLRLPHKLGQTLEITLQEKDERQNYTLTGIIKDRMDEKSSGRLEAFVAFNKENLIGRETHLNALVEFKEGVKIGEEIKKIGEHLGLNVNSEDVIPNKLLLSALGQLNAVDWNLVKMALMLMLVGGMVIYSVYSISVLRRIQEYGMMRAIGSTSKQIVYIMIWEIAILYVLGIVLGIVTGSAFVQLFRGVTTDVFVPDTIETFGNMQLDIIVISTFAIMLSVIVALGANLAAGIRAVLMATKISPVEAINRSTQDEKVHLDEKESCLERLLGIPKKISLKNLKRNKKAVIFTIVAMSIGCTLFMVQFFKLELFNRDRDYYASIFSDQHNEFRLNVNNTVPMTVGYTQEKIAEIKQLPQVQDVYAKQMLYSRLKLAKGQLNGHYGDNYIKYMNNAESRFDIRPEDIGDQPEDKPGFAFTGDNEDEIVIRNTVLGLSDDELNSISKILVKGELRAGEMSKKPLAILYIPEVNEKGSFFDETGKTKYKPALNIPVGDTITLTFPRKGYEKAMDNWSLIFQYEKHKAQYVDKEFTVAGIIRDLPETDHFWLGSEKAPYVLISNKMFRELSGIDTYRIMSIDMKDDFSQSDYQLLKEKVQQTAELIPGTEMGDKVQIIQEAEKAEKEYLLLYGSIAAVLIIIGGLSIYNNINYHLISRLREYGIMKAIGLTRKQFRKMIQFEGLLFGTIAAAFSCTVALIIELGIFLYYAYLSEHPLACKEFFIECKSFLLITLVNLAIGYIAALGPARQVDKIEITEAIRTVEHG